MCKPLSRCWPAHEPVVTAGERAGEEFATFQGDVARRPQIALALCRARDGRDGRVVQPQSAAGFTR